MIHWCNIILQPNCCWFWVMHRNLPISHLSAFRQLLHLDFVAQTSTTSFMVKVCYPYRLHTLPLYPIAYTVMSSSCTPTLVAQDLFPFTAWLCILSSKATADFENNLGVFISLQIFFLELPYCSRWKRRDLVPCFSFKLHFRISLQTNWVSFKLAVLICSIANFVRKPEILN